MKDLFSFCREYRTTLIVVASLVTIIVLFLVFQPRQEPDQFLIEPTAPDGPIYPRLANYFLDDRISYSELGDLMKWPVIITGWETQFLSMQTLHMLRKYNPDVTILAYLASNEFPLKNADVPPFDKLWEKLDETDWLLTPDGDYVRFWEGCRTFNLTQETTADKLVAFVQENLDPHYWDGIFWDNIWYNVEWYNNGDVDADLDGNPDMMSEFSLSWIRNELMLLRQTRECLEQDSKIVANVGGHNLGQLIANGRMFEDFPNCFSNTSAKTLNQLLQQYLEFCENAPTPQLVVVHSSGSETDSTAVRFGLTFTLMGDGYYAYDEGPSNHHSLWWYDEYYSPIGYPLSPAHQDEDTGVWYREFRSSDGFVLVCWNPTFEQQTLNLDLLDGSKHEIVVPMRDGVIYRLETVLALAFH